MDSGTTTTTTEPIQGTPAEVVDLSDDALRARGGIKWTLPDADVLPAWVAESDVAPAPAITEAVRALVARGDYGYPPVDADTGVPLALQEFAAARWGWQVPTPRVVLAGDVMAGVLLALQTLCEDAPVVVPTPAYPPFLEVVPLAQRPLVTVPLAPDAPAAMLDLDGIDRAFAAGARTLLLSNPHNPWGRAFTRPELEGLRDVVVRHGARVISDEIHAPLVLAGARHVPYASLDGTADHTTTVLSASKAWNLPGLKCAQIVTGTDRDADLLRALPLVANHGVATPGIAATVAAYREGGPWLDAWLHRLTANRSQFAGLVAERLPGVRMRPLEATYLAWLDVRGIGLGGPGQPDPAAVALDRGRVMVNDGQTFGPGGQGHVRVNLATSAERLSRIVERLALAWLG